MLGFVPSTRLGAVERARVDSEAILTSMTSQDGHHKHGNWRMPSPSILHGVVREDANHYWEGTSMVSALFQLKKRGIHII